MIVRRRHGTPLDVSDWPTFDAAALPETARVRFDAQHQAVIRYQAGDAIQSIENDTGVGRRQLYRCLDRCLSVHPDGRIWGWRALVPQKRTRPYLRSKGPERIPGSQAGLSGAFTQLMQNHPTLRDWLRLRVKRRQVYLKQVHSNGELRTRLGGLKHLHHDFVGQCRAQGISMSQYPFNTERLAVRSLSAEAKSLCLRDFGRAARLAGAEHTKGMPVDKAPAATEPLQVVEFDGHRLDLRLKIVVRDPQGYEQSFEIERIWLLAIIDVKTRAVLGYHVSLNREYSRHDVIRTIENALAPHRPMTFSIPGLTYGPHGGFASSQFPEMGYALWQWLKFDNAKANLSADVRTTLTEFVGCFIDAGPAHTPDDRPYIERLFKTIGENLSSRLPGFTGSHPKDLRRALSHPKEGLRLIVSLEELEELLEAAIGQYNGTPHDGLNGRTPLEAVEYGVRERGAMLTWLPEEKRRSLFLMHEPRRVRVRGYLHQGQRPHINFFGVRYTNEVLASTTTFIGQTLRIYFNTQDMRVVNAFTDDGANLGTLRAQGAWGSVAHDLKLRQEVIRLRGRKQLTEALSAGFLNQFLANKRGKARTKRRAASDLAQTLRTMDQGPSTFAPAPKAIAPPVKAPPSNQSPDTKRVRIEPEILTIGTGYVGTL